MRFAIHSSKGCIDSARMYPPGFAVYISLDPSNKRNNTSLASNYQLVERELWLNVKRTRTATSHALSAITFTTHASTAIKLRLQKAQVDALVTATARNVVPAAALSEIVPGKGHTNTLISPFERN